MTAETLSSVDYQAIEERYSTGVYAKRPVTIVRGEGSTVWDEHGRAYLDCAAGYGVANLGHCHPAVVAAMRGFHGRSFGALSATWEAHYRDPFAPLVPGFTHVPYNNLAALAGAVTEETAAVLLEVVQGEGGVRPGSAEFLRGAQQLCRERGALLIVDEVQTGMGRTGKLFAAEHHGIEPDVLVLAKSLGGGMPIGATAFGPRAGTFATGIHGSTFGGNPLACAAARAALRAIQEEHLPERAEHLGKMLLERLRELPSKRVSEVRGLGLMIGVELREKAAPYLRALLEQGIIALPAGPAVIRLLPPLVITEGELDRVVEVLHTVLAAETVSSHAA